MVTFIHSHIFLKYKGNYYTTGTLNNDVLSRYVDIFGQVTMLTRQKDVTEPPNPQRKITLPEVSFKKLPDFLSLSGLKNYPAAKKMIREQVEKSDFLILRTSEAANIAAEWAQKKGVPYLFEVVGCAFGSLWSHSLQGKLLAPIEFFQARNVIRNADWVVYVTNEFLQRRYPTNGKSIGCSDVSLGKPNPELLQRRMEKLRWEPKTWVLGTTSIIDVRYKGQQYVIQALGKLKQKGFTNFEYQLVGQGDPTYLKSVAKQCDVEEQVKFIGQLSHDKVFEWLETIDLYIQPSLQEGLPRAVIEAMSCGVPCLGSNIAGIPELLDSSMLFERKDVKKMVQLLKSLNLEQLRKEAQRNYEKAKEYDADVLKKRRQEFYQAFFESKH